VTFGALRLFRRPELTNAYLSIAWWGIIKKLSKIREVSGDEGIGPVVGMINIKGHDVGKCRYAMIH
jgi:hypothetical protein